MAPDIGRPGQDAVNLSDAPASAVTREDAPSVEMADDVLDPHWAAGAILLQGELIDHLHGVGVKGI